MDYGAIADQLLANIVKSQGRYRTEHLCQVYPPLRFNDRTAKFRVLHTKRLLALGLE